MTRLVQFLVIHQGKGAQRTPAGAVGDRQHRVQVVQQLGDRGSGRLLRIDFALRFQKKLRLFQDPLPRAGCAVAPGRIDLSGLPGVKSVRGKSVGHPSAVFEAHAGRRYQELHGNVGGDLARAHLLLDRLGKKFDQGQAARNPSYAPVKPAGQFIERVAEASPEFHQQPALLECRLALRSADRALQHQGIGLAHLPERRTHRVATQLAQRLYTLVAVDDQIPARLIRHRNNDDGHLLARGGQRSQESPLLVGTAQAQVLVAEIQLVKLQFHRFHPCRSLSLWGLLWCKPHLVLRVQRRKWSRNLSRINRMSLELVLRGTEEKSPHNSNKVSAFDSKLVLRDVPGKSRQRGSQTQRFRWACKRAAHLDSAGDEVIRVSGAPCRLRFLAAGSLAIGLSTGALACAYSRIRAEPAAADAAGFLTSVGHGDLSSPSHLNKGQEILRKRDEGSFLASRSGSLLPSAEGRRVCDKFVGRCLPGCTTLPIFLPATAQLAATQGNNCVGTFNRPVHSRKLEALPENGFASGLYNP